MYIRQSVHALVTSVALQGDQADGERGGTAPRQWSVLGRPDATQLKMLSDHAGIWGCTFVGECTQVCPKHVDPAGAIQQFKLTGALDALRSLLLPWGTR